MPKIRFTKNTGPLDGPQHLKGEVLECSEASREFWFARGVAVDADAPTEADDNDAGADDGKAPIKGGGKRK